MLPKRMGNVVTATRRSEFRTLAAMRVAVFSSKPYDHRFLGAAADDAGHELEFLETRLARSTTTLASGFEAVCVFVNDDLGAAVLLRLKEQGVKLIALRSAGFNHVDLEAAKSLGLTVVRVPAYSPRSVAEHTVALMLALNRKIHRAYARVREGNFALEGLLGFDIGGRTVGIVGTGKIGVAVAKAADRVRLPADRKRRGRKPRGSGVWAWSTSPARSCFGKPTSSRCMRR